MNIFRVAFVLGCLALGADLKRKNSIVKRQFPRLFVAQTFNFTITCTSLGWWIVALAIGKFCTTILATSMIILRNPTQAELEDELEIAAFKKHNLGTGG